MPIVPSPSRPARPGRHDAGRGGGGTDHPGRVDRRGAAGAARLPLQPSRGRPRRRTGQGPASGSQGGNDFLIRAFTGAAGVSQVTTTTNSVTLSRTVILLLANGAAVADGATISF